MVTIVEAARHLSMSERRFRELLDLDIIIRQPRGQYNLDVVRRQYLTHLRAVIAWRTGKFDDEGL